MKALFFKNLLVVSFVPFFAIAQENTVPNDGKLRRVSHGEVSMRNQDLLDNELMPKIIGYANLTLEILNAQEVCIDLVDRLSPGMGNRVNKFFAEAPKLFAVQDEEEFQKRNVLLKEALNFISANQDELSLYQDHPAEENDPDRARQLAFLEKPRMLLEKALNTKIDRIMIVFGNKNTDYRFRLNIIKKEEVNKALYTPFEDTKDSIGYRVPNMSYEMIIDSYTKEDFLLKGAFVSFPLDLCLKDSELSLFCETYSMGLSYIFSPTIVKDARGPFATNSEVPKLGLTVTVIPDTETPLIKNFNNVMSAFLAERAKVAKALALLQGHKDVLTSLIVDTVEEMGGVDAIKEIYLKDGKTTVLDLLMTTGLYQDRRLLK